MGAKTSSGSTGSWSPGGVATQTPEQVLAWVNNYLQNWLKRATTKPPSAGGSSGSGSSNNGNNSNSSSSNNSNDFRGVIPQVPGRGAQTVVTRRPSNNNNNGQQPSNNNNNGQQSGSSAGNNVDQDTMKRYNIPIVPPARVRNNRQRNGGRPVYRSLFWG